MTCAADLCNVSDFFPTCVSSWEFSWTFKDEVGDGCVTSVEFPDPGSMCQDADASGMAIEECRMIVQTNEDKPSTSPELFLAFAVT